ncbi:MAG: indole-3-glycerol-phosphate synthase, partial [Myxococcota bacterium]
FIIDRYQVTETRAMGADVILLIAHVLSPQQTQELSAFAQELGLEVLLEVHNAAEIDSHLNPHIDIIGVNNRNLDDFSVSLQTSFNLLEKLPSNITRISESGISKASEVKALKDAGYHGVLIGETFMSQSHPGKVCERLIRQVKSL